MSKILIIDDDQFILDTVSTVFENKYKVFTALGGLEGLDIFKKESPEIVLLDIMMPVLNGIKVLQKIKEIDRHAKVVIFSALQSIESAVEAMKLGADDYIIKPFNSNELMAVVEEHVSEIKLSKENKKYQKEKTDRENFYGIITKSKVMQKIFDSIERISKEDLSVLIYGESGTGKELVARAIHMNSLRSNNPFVPINCAAIPENLIESELFGYEKGAFTDARQMKKGQFEIADHGTIFLDEIGDINIKTQAKILRVLEEKEFLKLGGSKQIKVDVRFISATNRKLEDSIKNKSFREDLYFRINAVSVFIPPLRMRKEDIPLIAEYFLNNLLKDKNINIRELLNEIKDDLMKYKWPGNVRELKNTIEASVAMAKRDRINIKEIIKSLKSNMKRTKLNNFIGEDKISLTKYEKEFETELIREALEQSNHIQEKAARFLGISSRMLRYKMRKYGITE